MKKLLSLLLLVSVLAFGQASSFPIGPYCWSGIDDQGKDKFIPCHEAPKSIPTSTPSPLPQNFIASGAAYTTQPAIWLSEATLLNRTQGLYSFTTIDISSTHTHPFTAQTSVRSGFALVFKQIGPITLLILADGGASTAGSDIGAAYSGAGFINIPLGKTTFSIITGIRVLKTDISSNGTPKSYELGIGRSF